jgi:hypothetical protein
LLWSFRIVTEIGRDVTTVVEEKASLEGTGTDDYVPENFGVKTVSYEARYLRCLLMGVIESGIMTITSSPI